MNEGSELRPSPDVVHQRIEDDTVLVHLQTNRIYALNSTATRYWELLASGHDAEAIKVRLLEEFDIAEPELDEEIRELTSRLLAEGLLSRNSPA